MVRRNLAPAAAATLLAAAAMAVTVLTGAVGAQAGSVEDVAPEPPPASGATAIDVTDSGRVRKELGEPAGLVPAESNRPVFTITVESITVAETCPGRGVSVAPERGHFVIVDLAATVPAGTALDSRPADELFMPLAADAFTVIGTDGTAQAAPTEASWACFEDALLAPPFVGTGESASGKVVLDSAVSNGTLVYRPGGSAGWEWTLPS